MKINRNNYEVFIIDYYDQKLSAEEQSELLLFLENNPDLKEESEFFEQLLPVTNESFSKKNQLRKKEIQTYKGINEDNYENLFIAHFEGDLTIEETQDLQHFLGINHWLEAEFVQFGQLRLEPETNLVFTKKNELKQKTKISLWYYVSSVAAIFLLFFALYPFIFQNNIKEPVFQENTPVSESLTITKSENTINSLVENKSPEKRNDEKKISAPVYHSENRLANLTGMKSLTIHYNTTEIFEYAEPLNINYSESNFNLSQTTTTPERSSAIRRIVNNNIDGIVSIFKFGSREKNKSGEPVFVKMLDQSLMVFNTFTGSDAGLTKIYDQQGQLLSYGIEGELLKINRQVSRQSN